MFQPKLCNELRGCLGAGHVLDQANIALLKQTEEAGKGLESG